MWPNGIMGYCSWRTAGLSGTLQPVEPSGNLAQDFLPSASWPSSSLNNEDYYFPGHLITLQRICPVNYAGVHRTWCALTINQASKSGSLLLHVQWCEMRWEEYRCLYSVCLSCPRCLALYSSMSHNITYHIYYIVSVHMDIISRRSRSGCTDTPPVEPTLGVHPTVTCTFEDLKDAAFFSLQHSESNTFFYFTIDIALLGLFFFSGTIWGFSIFDSLL